MLDFLTLTLQSNIGGIEIAASLEEIHTDTVQVTEHPVEQGAAITDHAYMRPSEVLIRCGWSNSSMDALVGAATSFFSGGGLSGASYIDGIYSQLQALQKNRVQFNITTSRRQYTDMLITSLVVTTDNKTSNVLMVAATCRQIIIVSTQSTTLPPKANQASPADTAETENGGVNQLTANAMPSPGGTVAPSSWGGEAKR